MLRERVALFTFLLLFVEVLAGVGILIGVGLKALEIPVDLLKVIFPTLFIQIVGLAGIIARYLFDSKARIALHDLIAATAPGKRVADTKAKASGGNPKDA